MKWRKRGRVFVPDGSLPWARSYATIPTAEVREDGVIRVYFASLDDDRHGRIGFVDLDSRDPVRILSSSRAPILDLGEPGTFDDSGVNPSCILNAGGEKHLYYIGWQRCERVPYMLFSGLARWDPRREVFVRERRTPVLDRTDAEPFSRSAPFVRLESGGYRAWYWSCLQWTVGPDGIHYNNEIRSTTSADGRLWGATGTRCLSPMGAGEYSLGRPWVIEERGRHRMWFSARSFGGRYAIGYAESRDGVSWERRDTEAGISMSNNGWDSEMICYPCVVDAGGERYLFYNGNKHGSTGFGVAVLEQD
jgi:hypothetical protein